MEKQITLKSAADKYEVTIVKSAQDTNGEFSLLEVLLYPGGGNPLHIHTLFSERFEVVKGVLSIGLKNQTVQLHQGESKTVAPYTVHRFFNDGNAAVVFRATIFPARNFEKCLRIGYGLARDGKATKTGIPKNFWHAVLLFDLGDSYLHGLPLWFQRSVFGGLARIARWLKVDRAFDKYNSDEYFSDPAPIEQTV
jgi:mannose-6-phosphate isomerase-like protein (cupin superfamily)